MVLPGKLRAHGLRPGPPAPSVSPSTAPAGSRPASGTLLPSPWGWLLLKDLGPTAAGHTYLLPPERRAQRLALSVDPVPAALTARALLQAPAPAGGARCGARGLPGGSAGWRRVLRQHIPANLSHCPEASLGMWRLERSPLPVLVFGKATPRQRSHPRAGEGRAIPLARGRQVFPSRRGPK